MNSSNKQGIQQVIIDESSFDNEREKRRKEFLKTQFSVEKITKYLEEAKKAVDESELENNPNCEII